MTLKKLLERNKGILDDPYTYDGATIGLGEYPIFDESYRDALNHKIIEHFWNREIGQETDDMFILALRRKMNEIMPLYNQHYVLSQIAVDPLSTMDMKTILSGNVTNNTTGTADNTGTSTSGARTVNSDTPQTELAGDQDYASSLTDSNSSGNSTSTSTTTNNNTVTNSANNEISGYSGHQAALIYQARQALVNVDMMVIRELESLFMLIWDNGDEYFNSGIAGIYYGGLL